MKSFRNLVVVLIVSIFLPQVMKAQHHQKGNMGDHKMEHTVHYDVSQDFQNQLKEVFTAYIELKDALVASDAGKVAESTEKMADQLRKVNDSSLEDDADKAWMKSSGMMQKGLSKILSKKDLDIQRMTFSDISDTLYQAVHSFGVKNLDAYYQFCPMANNGDGAHWMSMDEAIKNPYYGSKMMKCGKTVEEL